MSTRYDLIIAGTGFAEAFFSMRYLERAPADARGVLRGASAFPTAGPIYPTLTVSALAL